MIKDSPATLIHDEEDGPDAPVQNEENGPDVPVHNEDYGPAARLEEADHPVVGLGPQLMDLQLRNHFTFPVNLRKVKTNL
jgi:hypothetical protein